MKNLRQKCNVPAWRPRPIICGACVACGAMQMLHDYLLLMMHTKLMQLQQESGGHQLPDSILNRHHLHMGRVWDCRGVHAAKHLKLHREASDT